MAAVQVQAAYVQAVDATGKPVMAVQQTPAQAQVVAVGGGGGGAMDVNAFQNLANASSLEFKQGNVFWEAVSGGCAANSYMIRDRLSADAHGKMTPVFIASEESSCWCRACCDPNQPAYVKFYNVANGGEKPAKKCCGLTISEAKTLYTKSGGAVMTLEKPGCWKNCAQMGAVNCFVCCSICQSEAFMHTGEIESRYDPQGCGPCKVEHWSFPQGGPGFAPKNRVFSHAQVPIFGGGCTPTVNIMARNGEMESPAPPPFAIVEGPTCFGGCMDLCCNTKFMISSSKGKSGDLGKITKKAPEGACACCIQLCTPADTYNIDFEQSAGLSPKQKAAIIGEMVHLDFLFFEAEQPLCRFEESNSTCYILLCTCYFFGYLCPCQLCIPCKSEGQ